MLTSEKPQSCPDSQFPIYKLAKIAESDNKTCTWPWYRRRLPHLIAKPLAIFSLACALRFVFLLWKAVENQGGHTRFVACCYLGIQISLMVARIIEDSWRFAVTKPRQRPRLRLLGDTVPRVDVVITTCGEKLNVVMDTVKAMCDLDYPADRFRVLVSDDGGSEALAEEVTNMSFKTPVPLLYYTRPNKGGMKAGNMNAAFNYLGSLDGAEYCAFADVDMMFEPEFLRASLPLLIEDDSVGVAVVPQRFYNLPTNDPLCQSLNADGELDEPLRDSMNCAWNTGPGVVFRRSAIIDIGGYPENALAEELLTGFKLQGRGWKTAYCHEELQWGLVPATLNAHVTQRVKWVVGRLRNGFLLNVALKSPLLEEMQWKQRLCAFCYCASPILTTTNRVCCSWLLIILIATGQPLVAAKTTVELRNICAAYLLSKAASRLEELVASTSCGFLTLRRRTEGTWWLNTHLVVALVKDMLPKSLGGLRIGFTPTALAESKIQERHADRRPPLGQRVRVMFFYQGCWYHVAILSVAALALSRGFFTTANVHLTKQGGWWYLLTHVLVPGAEWTNYLSSFRPISYALWPPTMPERRELMESAPSRPRVNIAEDGIALSSTESQSFKVWRPKKERKLEHWDASAYLPEVPRLLSLLFWCVVYSGWRS